MNSSLADVFPSLAAVAMGEKKANLILKNCRLVSVYTGEIIPGTEIAIHRDRIAYVGNDAGHAQGPDTKTINLKDRYVCPGLADPHLHIDQFVLPSEFARMSLPCGVTSLFSDPIDVVSAAGYRGFEEFLRLGEGLPIRIFQVVPGGLPVDPKFSKSMSLTPPEEQAALRHRHVLGMGEVFSWTKVTLGDPRTAKSISAMLERDCIINGHTAGASGKKLNAYVSSGIISCHEPINLDQTLERLRLGMWVMIREGSIRRDLKEIIPGILAGDISTDRLMFCTDGLDPAAIAGTGHIDHCIREAVGLGLDPVDAITIASRNSFDYYGMGRDLGGIAPGRLADMVVFENLQSFRPDMVFTGGVLAASDGKMAAPVRKKRIPPWARDTVRLDKLSAGDFQVKSKRNVTANTIFMLTEIVTRIGSASLSSDGLHVGASRDADVWKVAAFDRTHGTGRRCVGFLENFGAEIGAFASTWSFHENDMIVIGSDDSDMTAAANCVIRNKGGMAVVDSGKVVASMPLQFAGIASTDPFEKVLANFEGINNSIIDAGCKFSKPFLIPLFLPFLALPSVRILSGGMVDVKARRYIKPVCEA